MLGGLALILLASACGGGSSTTTAAGATATTGGDAQASRQAYRDCLAQNGVNLPARGQGNGQGNGQGDGSGGPPGTNPDGTPGGNFNPGGPRGQGTIPGVDQATMDKAREACKDLQPAGGFGGGGGAGGTAFQAYASCMKDHGVTIPARGNGSTDTSTPPSTIDRSSATYQAANDACKALLPTPGQGGGGIVLVDHVDDSRRMKRRRILNLVLAVALVATGVGIYTAVGPKASAKAKPSSVDVSTGTVLASVSASGTVVPSQQVNLNFLSSGVLLELDVKVGDRVSAGQVLAKIDPTAAQQQLTLAQAQLTAAQTNLTAAQSAATTTTTAAPTATSNAPSAAQSQAQSELQQAQAALAHDNAKLQSAQGQLAAAQSAFQQATTKVNKDLAFQQQCLADPATPPSGGLTCATVATQLQIDTAAQASAQASVSAAGVSVATAQQAVTADQAALATATSALSSAKSSSSSGVSASSGSGSSSGVGSGSNSASAVAQAQATVTSDQINVANAQKALDATTMTAPADGTVSSLSGVVGETVTAGSSAASATSGSGSTGSGSGATGGGATSGAAASSSSSSSSSSSFMTLTNLTTLQVQAAFTEADATKLVVGQKVINTFSALPNVQLQGEVAQVATTATTSNNVVSYATLINLDQVPADLKPGMTATAQVIVGEADNAVFVPASAVTGTGTNGTVTVVNDDGTTTVTAVTVGLRGDTTVEITSGLTKGQKVVRSTAVAAAATGGTGRTGAGGGTLTGTGGIGGGGGGFTGGGGGAGRVGG